jgi:nicotinamide phosphoribosyltransferase
MLTITNTHKDFGWLVNYLETLISCMLWQPITSATIAYEYKKLLNKYALETTGSTEGVQWQGHDFSMRGMSSVESAILSGMGHLLSFTGTDTIPAIYQLEKSYNAGENLIGASVPATEHSVMCMGTKEAEIDTFRRLLKLYPTGILSVVSDTWNLWDVCTKFLPELKSEIMARDGKLVIRPDSGDPVDIICGTIFNFTNKKYENGDSLVNEKYNAKSIIDESTKPEFKGVIELLWETFGGTINEQGYKVLDPHIGAIYGDSITLDRAKEICERLKAKGFASTNIVLGIGSYTYQYNTRDTFGFAMKATYGEITNCDNNRRNLEIEAREIFKDPITDDGTKKSKKGLLQVDLFEKHNGNCDMMGCDMNGCIGTCKELSVKDQCTWEQEAQGLLTTVFKDGKLVKETTLDKIRKRLNTM